MNENLNAQLFNPGPPELGPRLSELGKFQAPVPKYMQTLQRVDNPLHDAEAWRATEKMGMYEESRPEPTEEWIPTSDLQSSQGKINPYAVNHLVENSTGLDVPDIPVVRAAGRTAVWDGNHRANAAQRRGQMIVPARVYNF